MSPEDQGYCASLTRRNPSAQDLTVANQTIDTHTLLYFYLNAIAQEKCKQCNRA